MPRLDRLGRFIVRLRWPLVVLYGLVVAALYGVAIREGEDWAILAITIALGAQLLFWFAGGDLRELRPVTFHRSWLPALIAGALATVLVLGIVLAGAELLRLNDPPGGMILALILLGSWLGWALLFAVLLIGRPYLKGMRRLVLLLIGGSLLQLTATVSAHMIVLRRGGCFVGISTSLGIACGAAVLLWAFGPGVILLFYHESRKRLRGHCPGCGYDVRGLPERRCPECGRRFRLHEVGLTAEQLQARVQDAGDQG